MSAEFTEEILVEAFCKTVACTGFGAFETVGKENFDEEVLKSIPENQQADFRTRLLLCATNTCTKKPYSWEVDQTTPVINSDTTFGDLFDDWFKSILSEV
jgi:hypothetical protein